MKKDLLSAFAITAMFMCILLVSAAEPYITTGAKLTEGVGSGLYTLQADEGNGWYIIFPATTGKPNGCTAGNASPADWTATGFLMGMLTAGQLQYYDTDSAVWASSKPVGTSRNYVSFGGPLVNNFPCYYEGTAGSNVVLAIYQLSGGNHQFVANSIDHPVLLGNAGPGIDFNWLPLQMAAATAGSSGTDLFLLEGFEDPATGNVFLFAYGFTYYGTFAAGIYLKFKAAPFPAPFQPTGLKSMLYIVEWIGTAGALPAAADTYTIVYSQDS